MPTLSMRVLQEQINDLRNEIAVLKATSKSINLLEGLGIGDTFKLVDTTWKILDITRMRLQLRQQYYLNLYVNV